MFLKQQESAKALSFFNPNNELNRQYFTDGTMTDCINNALESSDDSSDKFREIQILLKDTLKQYVQKKQRLRTVMTLFIGTEQVLYTARKSFMYGEPGLHCHIHGVLHDERDGSNYINFSTCHKGVNDFSVVYINGSIRINHFGNKLYIPVVQGEEEYFQMQLLYPWLILTYDEYELFRSILEYVSTDSVKRFRYHYVRVTIDFIHVLINYAMTRLKIVNVKYLPKPQQE